MTSWQTCLWDVADMIAALKRHSVKHASYNGAKIWKWVFCVFCVRNGLWLNLGKCFQGFFCVNTWDLQDVLVNLSSLLQCCTSREPFRIHLLVVMLAKSNLFVTHHVQKFTDGEILSSSKIWKMYNIHIQQYTHLHNRQLYTIYNTHKCIHSLIMSKLKQENKCRRITFLQEIVIYHLLSLKSFKTCMHFFLSWTWKILWSMSKLLHTENGHLGLLISIVVKKQHGSCLSSSISLEGFFMLW